MSEIPTDVAEHVSISEDGVIMLSETAQAVMEGVEPPILEEAPQATPAEETPKVETRKIKWNGQEVEVAPEQETELLQKGYNYEQKMAALEAERARVQAYSGLVSAIEASPEIKAKVAQALGYQSAQPTQDVPQFDDPIEQLKWETRQEVLKEVEEKFIKPIQTQTQMTAHQQALAAVRQQVQADPQFAQVQAEIINQIKAMPESIGKNLYLQLDQDPKSYMEMFQTVKARLKPSDNHTTNLPQAESPQPTKRETKAPILESGNNAPVDTAEAQKMQEHIKELTRRSKNGDFKATGELMAMMA